MLSLGAFVIGEVDDIKMMQRDQLFLDKVLINYTLITL